MIWKGKYSSDSRISTTKIRTIILKMLFAIEFNKYSIV